MAAPTALPPTVLGRALPLYSVRTGTFAQTLVQQYQAGEGGIANHADGIDVEPVGTHKRSDEERYADGELPGILCPGREVLLIEKHQGCGSKQADDTGAQA